jgi:NAD(P)-dependent dehydrogenase (short-subunit alcohol dehydrogenase family)
MKLSGVIAVVTGGASGLGAATVRRLLAEGADVIAIDRDEDRGRQLVSETGARFVRGDVADAGEMEALFADPDMAQARVLVCCAGIGGAKMTVRRDGPHDLETFERIVRVNLTGTFNCIRLAAWNMSKLEPRQTSAEISPGERGVIVMTASIAAFDGVEGGAAYSASKAGVAGMTLPLARDLGRHAIRVNSIAPGTFATPMVELLPDEFSKQLSDETPFPDLANFLIQNSMMNGETVRIDGAMRMRPGRLR